MSCIQVKFTNFVVSKIYNSGKILVKSNSLPPVDRSSLKIKPIINNKIGKVIEIISFKLKLSLIILFRNYYSTFIQYYKYLR